MIDDLVGRAMMRNGYQELLPIRNQLDRQTLQSIISVLGTVDRAEEQVEVVVQRDMAYCERVYGWQARLSNVVAYLTKGEPSKWKNFASFSTAVDSWRVLNQLFQNDLAIHAFQKTHGRFPSTLEELVPEFLPSPVIDPLTNRPFVYRTDAAEFTLYSIGRDGRDNSGRFTNLTTYNSSDGYDLDLDSLTRP
jgi:hypothetical protein